MFVCFFVNLVFRCRGIFFFPGISTCRKALVLWGLFWQMTRVMAARGHQGLKFMAITALWHTGEHRAATSLVLSVPRCGDQASRHLPLYEKRQWLIVGHYRRLNVNTLGVLALACLCLEMCMSSVAGLAAQCYLTCFCHYESWNTCREVHISAPDTLRQLCLSLHGCPTLTKKK